MKEPYPQEDIQILTDTDCFMCGGMFKAKRGVVICPDCELRTALEKRENNK